MTQKTILSAAFAAALAGVFAAGAAQAAAADFDPLKTPSGAAFAHTCAACHGTYGYSRDSAFPSLAGMPADVFTREMIAFKHKERQSSIMSHIADGYSREEIERMAEFFAKLPPLKRPEAAALETAEAKEGAAK